MLPVAEAQARILAPLAPLPPEWVTLPQARGPGAGRGSATRGATSRRWPSRPWTATPCAAPIPRRSAGRSGSSARPRRAAIRPVRSARSEAVRIFTGGAVPPGADAIVIQENADAGGDTVRFAAAGRTRHLRARGRARFRAPAGPASPPAPSSTRARWASPPPWAISGCRCGDGRGSGCSPPATSCAGRARRPQGSQIISSNTLTVGAMVDRPGAPAPVDLGICPDDGDGAGRAGPRGRRARPAGHHRRRLGRRLRPRPAGARAARAWQLDFWKIAMRPGKPLLFGRLGGLPGAGLPGQPGLDRRSAPSCSCASPCSACSACRSGCRERQRSPRPSAGRPTTSARTICAATYVEMDGRASGPRPPPARTARCWPPSPPPTRWSSGRRSIRPGGRRHGDADRPARGTGQPALEGCTSCAVSRSRPTREASRRHTRA